MDTDRTDLDELADRLKCEATQDRHSAPLFGNDEFINGLIQDADSDNRRKERGTLAALLVHINHAHRLHQAEQHGLLGKRWIAFAERITGYKKSKAYELHALHPFALQILERCESDRGLVTSQPYEYPSWRTALAWFRPKPSKPVEDEEEAPEPDAAGADDDGGLTGKEDPISPAAKATIEIMAQELAEAHAEIARLQAELALRPPRPPIDRTPDEQLSFDIDAIYTRHESQPTTAPEAQVKRGRGRPRMQITLRQNRALGVLRDRPDEWNKVPAQIRNSVVESGWVAFDPKGVPMLTDTGRAILGD